MHPLDIIEWIGSNRLIFATDDRHPATCLRVSLTETQRAAVFHGNAWRFFMKD